MTEHVYLLIGSNLGDRISNLKKAAQRITASAGAVSKQSGIYKTAAWGKTDQNDFLNQVLIIDTTLPPDVLLDALLLIEKEMGRVRLEEWGERIIDIDILYYGSHTVDMPTLKIPHPHLQNRRFALIPLREVAPHFVHPVLYKTPQQLLDSCPDTLSVERIF